MTNEEIKNGLTVCADDFCDGCSYYKFNNCYDKLKLDALNLITEQEKEIERLRTTLGQCNTELNSALESLKSQCREIGELKDDYAKLQELFAQYQMASDKEIKAQKKEAEKRFENNMKSVLEIEKKQAVKDFAEKVKEEVYPFLQAEMYNKKHFITGDLISDKLLENQNIGILKAQDVLSKWFKVKIDELIKEAQND